MKISFGRRQKQLIMKYCICILFLHLATLSAAFSNSGYTLTMQLSGIPDSKNFLASIRGDAYKIIDTAELKNKVYFSFLKQESLIQEKLDLLRNMLDQYPADDELYGPLINRYNDLQKEK